MAYRPIVVTLVCIIGLAARPGVSVAYADAPQQSWWMEQSYSPDQKVARGIPAKKYNPAWVGLRALSLADLPRDVRAHSLGKFTFVARADLNRNGIAETISVGVYRDVEDKTGRYLAITERGRVLKTFAKPGQTGFSALLRTRREVRWYFCMECEDFERLTWTGGTYVLD